MAGLSDGRNLYQDCMPPRRLNYHEIIPYYHYICELSEGQTFERDWQAIRRDTKKEQ